MSVSRSLVWAFLMMQVGIFSTTIYLHRGLAHRALRFARPFAFFLRSTIFMFTGMVPRQWVAIHRKHHHFTDVEGDPHSPMLFGYWKIQFGNVYFYRREARNAETIEKYAPDLRPDWWDRRFFDRSLLGPSITIAALWPIVYAVEGASATLLGSLFWAGLTFGFSAVFFVVGAAGVNALGHMVGYKNFDNTATNLKLLALITGGEGLHNNHHARPGTARFSARAGEALFDLGYHVIRVLSVFRLVAAVKDERPQTAVERRKVA
jgi:stearoyl-CoA desaturase (Delta-9 desaturase)